MLDSFSVYLLKGEEGRLSDIRCFNRLVFMLAYSPEDVASFLPPLFDMPIPAVCVLLL